MCWKTFCSVICTAVCFVICTAKHKLLCARQTNVRNKPHVLGHKNIQFFTALHLFRWSQLFCHWSQCIFHVVLEQVKCFLLQDNRQNFFPSRLEVWLSRFQEFRKVCFQWPISSARFSLSYPFVAFPHMLQIRKCDGGMSCGQWLIFVVWRVGPQQHD